MANNTNGLNKTYNATVISYDRVTGDRYYTGLAYVAEINGRPQMLFGNGAQCTGFEGLRLAGPVDFGNGIAGEAGDAAYDLYIRAQDPGLRFEIILDGGDAYKTKIRNMGLPRMYRAAAE